MKKTLIAVLGCVLASCTTYDQGSGSYWIGPSTLVVSGAGNGFTSAQRVSDFVYLQAAEKALETGYPYFALRAKEDTSTVTTATTYTPTTTTVTGTSYGNTFSGTATTYGGPSSFNVYKPGLDAVFEMFQSYPTGYRVGQFFVAADVYHELGPKYLGSKYNPDKYQYGRTQSLQPVGLPKGVNKPINPERSVCVSGSACVLKQRENEQSKQN